MRIFLAGATGVLGRRLVPLLTVAGHSVVGMTRSTTGATVLESIGAEPVVCDVYDADALTAAVVAAAPDLVMHQLTDLPDTLAELGPATGAANARIRREGTRNLLSAAAAAGARHFVAQSVAWTLPGDGAAAVADLERMVLEFGGVVLRYGQFYGPDTYHENVPDDPRVHIDEAARATVALMLSPSGTITVVDGVTPA